MSVADISVHILYLGKVLLRHLDQLRTPRLLRQLGGALVLGGRVLIVVPVFLQQGTQDRARSDMKTSTPTDGSMQGAQHGQQVAPLPSKSTAEEEEHRQVYRLDTELKVWR